VKRVGVFLIAALLGAGLVGVGRDLALSVTDVDPGVRGTGLGGAGVAAAYNVEALYYNPARLANAGGASFQSFYAAHLGALDYTALGVSFPSWGVGYLVLSSRDVHGYSAGGTRGDELRYRSSALLLGFGASPQTLPFLPRLPFDWAVGTRLAILSSRLGSERGSGFGLDLAASIELGSLPLGGVAIDDLSVGIYATNLLGTVGYDARRETLLTDGRLGVSAVIAGQVLATFDYQMSGRVHIGAEYRALPTVALRVGILHQRPGASITLGVGLNLEGFGFDYAYMSSTGLSGSHRLALSIDFAAVDLGALTSMMRRILP